MNILIHDRCGSRHRQCVTAVLPWQSSNIVHIVHYTYGFERDGSNRTDSPEYQQLVDALKAQFEQIVAA
ncbi:hypothetical protein EXS66_02890 [Candidatus Saccharibacteria bacterium]|nr:hypothetical protein [Candidatus Saccharibacteria bacterium]